MTLFACWYQLDIAAKLIESVQMLHRAGVVHGRLTPEHILIISDTDMCSSSLPAADSFSVKLCDLVGKLPFCSDLFLADRYTRFLRFYCRR